MTILTKRRPGRSSRALIGGVVMVLVATLSPSGATVRPTAENARRLLEPEDRYAMAGGCYAVRSAAGRYVVRGDGGFSATATGLLGGEPFHFQATDLGRYLLYGKRQDFLAASDGTVGTIATAVTGSDVGGDVGGVTIGKSNAAANALARGPLGVATGRGAKVVAAGDASELGDWTIKQVGTNRFTLELEATHQILAAAGGRLLLEDSRLAIAADRSTQFGFHRIDGCARFPEVEIDVDGPVARGATPFSEVRGFLDAHVHMMAFEFIGGSVRCGKPWDPYGVTKALVDCPDHKPGGRGAVLEAVLSGGNPVKGHDTVGWPTFGYWPRYNSLTHEQLYYRWLERAWRGGLRLFVNLLVDNHALCTVYPLHKHGCNEMSTIRLEAQMIKKLERYIDAQSGGPGEGWFRIVTDPFQAREVINSGKLAVVLGIETSLPFDCREVMSVPRCDKAQIARSLDQMYALGVRDMLLGNKFDNALAGITGDGGTTGLVVNSGNHLETGHYWQMGSCPGDGEAHDHTQLNVHDDAHTPDQLTGRDSIFAGVLEVAGKTGAAPLYPPAPQCNVRGLTALGAYALQRMMAKGMIFDPDHLSARARTEALDILQRAGYSGVVSSHSWSDDTIYPRVYQLGGVVTPYAGSSTGFVADWKQRRQWADPRFLFGIGYGSDVNGFGAQGAPRGANAPNKVTYPFTGFGGTTIYKQRSGERVYDINVDGVAHYGLYPDWIEDLRRLAGDAIVHDMELGPEAYLEMWERAIGIRPNACRSDIADVTDGQMSALQPGMSPTTVLETVGQPNTRTGAAFTYCMTGGRTATVTFTSGGSLTTVQIA
jgi:hypothetical protein